MNVSQFTLYVKMVRAWLSARKGMTIGQAIENAVITVGALAHIDLAGPFGQLVLHILQGLILGNDHHQEVVDATGNVHPAGPVMNAAQAVALAIKTAEEHPPLSLDPTAGFSV